MLHLMFTSVAALRYCLMLRPDVELFSICAEIGARLQQYTCSQLSFSIFNEYNLKKNTQNENVGV